jgi:hypothetical protein
MPPVWRVLGSRVVTETSLARPRVFSATLTPTGFCQSVPPGSMSASTVPDPVRVDPYQRTVPSSVTEACGAIGVSFALTAG